jgi:phospholipase C
VFDHTSIIKTILKRFCADKNGKIPNMGARVGAAKHLGELLTEDQPRPRIEKADYKPLLEQAAAWHEQMVQVGTHTQGQPAAHALSDFQEEFIDAKRELLAARQQIAAAAGVKVPE